MTTTIHHFIYKIRKIQTYLPHWAQQTKAHFKLHFHLIDYMKCSLCLYPLKVLYCIRRLSFYFNYAGTQLWTQIITTNIIHLDHADGDRLPLDNVHQYSTLRCLCEKNNATSSIWHRTKTSYQPFLQKFNLSILQPEVQINFLTNPENEQDYSVPAWDIKYGSVDKQCGSKLLEIQDPMRWIFSMYLILPAALSPGDYSASNRNEY
jgi:hypothetical protein